jgi:RNA polymerase sigma factor (sigma-70 family)
MGSAVMQRIGQVTAQQPEAEKQLIERVANGDRQALAHLYERYHLPLFRYLLHLTSDHGLAEELLQDTLVAVWRSAHTYKGTSRLQTWLFGIARRQAHNTLRRRGVRLADVSHLDAVPAPDPEATLLTCVERDKLNAAMSLLAVSHREVLLLIFVEELSYRETAAVLNVPIGTVKSRLSYAKRALRILLNDQEAER